MTPERRATIGDSEITEYYWNGKGVVYVNRRAVPWTFDEAVRFEAMRKAAAGMREATQP